MKQILVAVALVMVGLLPGVSQAATIFSDNFDGESHGINYNSFLQWQVIPQNGTVDLVGGPPPSSFFNYLPGNGNYVDLDGSTLDAGIMLSNPLLLLANTSYELTFQLAGSQRGDMNLMNNYGIDNTGDNNADFSGIPLTRNSSDPFTTVTVTFATGGGPLPIHRIVFGQLGGDNKGMFLDNVTVKSNVVPEPASLMLLGVGLAAIGIWRRKAAKV